jgi:uncharacterized membrane protein
MRTEPVRWVSVAVAIVLLCLPHLAVFGVPVTQEQVDAINNILPSVVVLLGGEVIRSQVSPARKP